MGEEKKKHRHRFDNKAVLVLGDCRPALSHLHFLSFENFPHMIRIVPLLRAYLPIVYLGVGGIITLNEDHLDLTDGPSSLT